MTNFAKVLSNTSIDSLIPVFAYRFNGVVWNTVTSGENRLFVEVRNEHTRQVTFSALDVTTGEWLWKDITFDESWWISLSAASGNIVLFTVYTDVNDPSEKSVLAFHSYEQKVLWWKNHFSISTVSESYLSGIITRPQHKEVVLALTDGREVSVQDQELKTEQNFQLLQPFHYYEGSEHYETVRAFLTEKFGFSPVTAIEYREYKSKIFISFYEQDSGLANYLIVLNRNGERILQEKLAEQLGGIGLDTFFILSGYLIFVKNKRELISYRIL